MEPVIFIVGPTAVGKSLLAINLARKLKTEIVSCDSMLVYKEPSIITSKPSQQLLNQIKHYFVDIISVTEDYDVFRYYKEAVMLIQQIAQSRPVIVCGGSGLYVKSILDGIFEGATKDLILRKTLEEEATKYGKEFLIEKLKKIDPETAEKVKDLRRIIRAIEVYQLTGIPISLKKKQTTGLWGRLNIKIFGLVAERKSLYERINRRVEEMFKLGAVDEVKNLLKLNLSLTAQKIIGIKEIKGFLDGSSTLEDAIELMKKNTRHFAKRQLTWFRKDNRIKWIDVDKTEIDKIADTIIEQLN